MSEPRPGLSEYKRDLVREKNRIIDALQRRVGAKTLKKENLDDAVNREIEERLFPIEEKYEETVQKDLRRGWLDLTADKIRSAFAPKIEPAKPLKTREDSSLPDIKNSEFIEKSSVYRKINEKQILYSSLPTVVDAIIDKIKKQPSYSSQQVVLDFLPVIDALPDSDAMTASGIDAEKSLLLKEIANAIFENRNPSNNSNPNDREKVLPLLRSVLKKIGKENTNLKNTDKVEEVLCNGFLKIAPQFDRLSLQATNFKLFSDVVNFAKTEQEKKAQTLKKIAEKKFVALDLLGNLDGVLSNFEIRLRQDGIFPLNAGESPNISEKKQEELLKDLKTDVLPVLTQFNQSVYKPTQDNLLRLNRALETLDTIDALNKVANPNQSQLDLLIETLKSLGVEFNLKDDVKAKKQELEEEIKIVDEDLNTYGIFMTLADEKKIAFIKKFGLDNYLDSIRSAENLEKVDPWAIYQYLRVREIPYWTALHHDSDDEFDKKLVYFVKYQWGGEGKGWESAGSRLGLAEDWWASEEGRLIMGMLQTTALRGKLTHGAPYAEGEKERLFAAFKECHLDKGPLYEKTVGHPTIGPLLTVVLDIYRDLPTLKTGKLPSDEKNGLLPEDYFQDLALLRSIMKSDEHYNKFLPRLAGGASKVKKLDQRLVIRNGRKVKLAADRVIKNSDGKLLFLPGDEMLPGDKEYLSADSDSSYHNLVGSNGKVEYTNLISRSLEIARKYPKRFGLKNKDLLNASDDKNFESAVIAVAEDVAYALPFLTDIYAQLTDETLTAAHPINTSDYNWHRILNFRGLMNHDGLRYGKPSPETWLAIHLNKLQDGISGPSGIPDEINLRREALISYDEAKYGPNFMKHVVGKMGDLHQFTNALKMMQISPTEEYVEVRLSKKKTKGGGQYDGYEHDRTIYLGNKKDGVPAMGWDLYNVSSKAFLEFMDLVNGSIKDDSISFEDLMKSDGPIWHMLAKVMGQFKMWSFGEEDDPDNVIMQMSGALAYYFIRVARAVDKKNQPATINEQIFEYIISSIMKATGLITGNIASEGEVGLTKGQVFKVATSTLQILMGIDPTKNKVSIHEILNGKDPTPGSVDSHRYREASEVRFALTGRKIDKPPISEGFGPVPKVDRAGLAEFIPVLGRLIPVWRFPRKEAREKALRSMWELERKVSPSIGEWPFKFYGSGETGAYLATEKLEFLTYAQGGLFKDVTNQFEDMLYGRQKMRVPLARPKYGLSAKN